MFAYYYCYYTTSTACMPSSILAPYAIKIWINAFTLENYTQQQYLPEGKWLCNLAFQFRKINKLFGRNIYHVEAYIVGR